jgi:hypothetical protein
VYDVSATTGAETLRFSEEAEAELDESPAAAAALFDVVVVVVKELLDSITGTSGDRQMQC